MFSSLRRKRIAQSAIEYLLIATIVLTAVIVVGSISQLQNTFVDFFNRAVDKMK